MVTYLFHSTLLLSGFTLFYYFVLRNETYFKLNRWVILGGVLLCLATPLIQVPASMSFWNNSITPTDNILESISQAPAQFIGTQSAPTTEETSTQAKPIIDNSTVASSFSWVSILGILYVIGVVIFFLIFLIQVVILLTQRYNLNSFQTGKYTIVEMLKDTEPCSFLNYIYINPTKYDEETYNHIIEHEKAHIDQSHFVDKVIAELLIVLFWFNPFTWLLRKSISQNLEFLTDRSLINQGIQKDKYQMSLLKLSVSNKPMNLTASYNSSFLKSRILMMNAQNSSVVSAWKYLFIIPLFVLSIASLNAVQDNGLDKNMTQKSTTTSPNSNISSDNVSKEIELPHLNKIALGMSGNLSISYGKEQKITITGPQELVDQISTEVVDQNWKVAYRVPGFREQSNQVTVYAQLTDLTHLALSGKGRIVTTNRFENLGELYIALSGDGYIDFAGDTEFVNAALSGTGNIKIDTKTTKMNTALSGTGNITFTGQANDTKIVCSGSGNINTVDFISKISTVVVSGSSSVSVNAKESLSVTADGTAYITYRGNPKIKKDLKSEARVERID